jgi:uncharacterized membrane protein
MSSIIPKPDLKFFISWISCSIGMFGMSYLWHGVFLNDFIKISYPVDVFLTIAALVYLGIGLCITILTYVGKKVKDSFKYGMLVGAIAGVFIYAIAFLLGISFYTQVDMKIIVFDLSWQVFEQAFGGLVCGWFYRFLYVREKQQLRMAD